VAFVAVHFPWLSPKRHCSVTLGVDAQLVTAEVLVGGFAVMAKEQFLKG
jgi:hypothetical protein